MEDGIEQHMSILIQMKEEKREKAEKITEKITEKIAEKVAEKVAEKKQNTLIEEQIHPIGLTLTNTNSG